MEHIKKTTPTQNRTPQRSGTFFQQEEGKSSFFQTENVLQRKPFFEAETEASNTVGSAIQAKLTIGQPNDKYEQEADQVADQVVQRMDQQGGNTQNAASTTPTTDEEIQLKEEENQPEEDKVQLKTIDAGADDPEDNVQRKETGLEQEEENIQAMPINSIQAKGNEAGTLAPTGFQQQLSSSKGGGQSLDSGTRSSMESAFSRDFSNVRIHTGSQAQEMSQSINAKAFTNGSDIYFNSGQYDTFSKSGQHLLAHELTHTVQQGTGQEIQRKPHISQTNQKTVQRGIWGSVWGGIKRAGNWVKEKAAQAGEWVLEKLKQGISWLAETMLPGFALLNVVMGKNLITDEKVPRSGQNLIRAYMFLTPAIGRILYNELLETNALTEAGIWAEGLVEKMGIDFDDVARRLDGFWELLDVLKGANYNLHLFNRLLGPVMGKLYAFSSVVLERVKELRFEAALRLVGATDLLKAIKRDPKTFKRIVDNPKIILNNYIKALKSGFQNFKDNFGLHFKNALFGWLFGKAAEMGVEIPKEFTVLGLFRFIAQLVGATYQQIRMRVVKGLGAKGEMIMTRLEQGVGFVKKLVTDGPGAIWETIKEKMVDFKTMIFEQISSLVLGEVIKKATMRLVAMLIPGAGLVTLAFTLYKVVKYFIDWWERIKEIVNNIIGAITKVVLGFIEPAAKFIETTFARGMTLIIGFLASIFGLGGLVRKVQNLLKKIGKPILKLIGGLVSWLIKKGRALFGGGKKDKPNKKQADKTKFTDKDCKKAVDAFEKEEKPFVRNNKISQKDAKKVAGVVAKKHPVFKKISVVDGNDDWEYKYVMRVAKTQATKSKKQNDIEELLKGHLNKAPKNDIPPELKDYYEYYAKSNRIEIRRKKGKATDGIPKLHIHYEKLEGDDTGETTSKGILKTGNKEGASGRLAKPGELAKNMGFGSNPAGRLNQQFHHAIPNEQVTKHQLMILARDKIGYDLDRASNGIRMPANDEGAKKNPMNARHRGSHGGYNQIVMEELNIQYDNLKIAAKEKGSEIENGDIEKMVKYLEAFFKRKSKKHSGRLN